MKKFSIIIILLKTILSIYSCSSKSDSIKPIRVQVDLNINELKNIQLSNGNSIQLKLLEINEKIGSLRGAVRECSIKVLLNGKELTIPSGGYNLPVVLEGLMIDCPVTKSYYKNTTKDRWGLTKDARVRIWPEGPYITPGTFGYPIRQSWFASLTQGGNASTYVDAKEIVSRKVVYYHSGIDFGGVEGMDEIISSTDGLVISSMGKKLEGYDNFPDDVRADVLYIMDNRGWYYRYSHLDSIIKGIEPGVKVRLGQKVGYIGKQGHSGGWVHLHFEIRYIGLEGKWVTEEAFPYIWESYINEYKPPLIALARPHLLTETGKKVILNGSKSKGISNKISSFEWTLSNGEILSGPIQEIEYEHAGTYSEVLKVTDIKGNVDYDFTTVIVADNQNLNNPIPILHAAYHPTLGIKVGDPVTFEVRAFNCTAGNEVWDFGDDTKKVTVKSEFYQPRYVEGDYAKAIHQFESPGHYIVSVERINKYGYKAIAKLHVEVNR